MNDKRFAVPPGGKVRLDGADERFETVFKSEEEAEASFRHDAGQLARYQDMLLAHDSHAVLILFQAIDGAGKDDTIKHVLSGVDPQGCYAAMCAEPSKNELKGDYLRRYVKALPESGRIGIFNRSYYEQVTTERVRPEKLKGWRLSGKAKGEKLWKQRYREINDFERYLSDNGILILKFFLHISKATQRERLLERTRLPEKKWKFAMDDVQSHRSWGRHMKVYEEEIRATGTDWAPGHVIPADSRWRARAAVASVIAGALRSLHTRYPAVGDEQRRNLLAARKLLEKK